MVSVFTPRLLQNRKVTNIEQAVLGKTWSRERGTSENLMFDFIAPLPFVDKTLSYSHTLIALKNDSNPVKKKHNAPSGKELSSYFLYIRAEHGGTGAAAGLSSWTLDKDKVESHMFGSLYSNRVKTGGGGRESSAPEEKQIQPCVWVTQ